MIRSSRPHIKKFESKPFRFMIKSTQTVWAEMSKSALRKVGSISELTIIPSKGIVPVDKTRPWSVRDMLCVLRSIPTSC